MYIAPGSVTTSGKMILPGKPGPQRFHHCIEHDLTMTPVKIWGKGMMFSCKEGCRLGKYATVLK